MEHFWWDIGMFEVMDFLDYDGAKDRILFLQAWKALSEEERQAFKELVLMEKQALLD